jgi:hypothetical protein
MKVEPIYLLEHLTDEQIQEYECSDRIWFPRRLFEQILQDMSEPDILYVIKLENSLEQKVYGTPYQPHHNSNDDTIYIPYWMYQTLELDNTNITIEHVIIDMLTRVTIQPYTSDHIYLADPETALRNAFEQYSVIMMNMSCPLLLPDGTHLKVDICGTEPKQFAPLCIRSSTIELELLRPLDMPPSPILSHNSVESPREAVTTPPSPILSHNSVESPREAAPINREELRMKMAEAARRRLDP